ncbi:MAG: hypothetical protein ACKVQQ_03355 [Burkholderiales bacterium]
MHAPQIPILLLTGPSRTAKAALLDLMLAGCAGERTLVIENEAGYLQSHRLVAHGRDGGSAVRIRPCVCCRPAASWTATLRDATWRFSRHGVRQFDAVVFVASARADPAELKRELATEAPAARCLGTLLAVDGTSWLDRPDGDDAARAALQAADWIWTGEAGGSAERLYMRMARVDPRSSRIRAADLVQLMTNCAPSILPAATT